MTTGPVEVAVRQDRDALASNQSSMGTSVIGGPAVAVACPQEAPCLWATVVATDPNAAIQSGALAGLPFEAGSGWPAGFDGNADALRITTAAEGVLYDFETVVPVDLLSFGVD